MGIASAAYNGSNDTVSLIPKAKLNLSQPDQPHNTAVQLTDLYGRALQRNHGGDFVAPVMKGGVSISMVGATCVRGRLVIVDIGSLACSGFLGIDSAAC